MAILVIAGRLSLLAATKYWAVEKLLELAQESMLSGMAYCESAVI
jgi:hypothetical protein